MSKKLLLTLLLLNSSLLAFSQGTWSPRSPLPSPDSAMVQGIPGFSIGNYGYAGLGDTYGSGNTTPDFYQFDPSTNLWTKKAPFPGKARVSPACFVIGTNAYIVTGSTYNNGPCVTECWEYNSINDTWTRKADFPGTARTYALGFAIDSLGYVGTGANELTDFRKDFYAYHPSTDTWTRIADLPGIARDAANGFAVNGKGYVCFGQDSLPGWKFIVNDIYEYNPIANVWAQKNSYTSSSYCNSGFAYCNNFYIISGEDSATGLGNLCLRYNTLTDSWTKVATYPGSAKMQGAAFAIGDTGYYGFGCVLDSGLIIRNVFKKFFIGDSCNNYAGIETIEEKTDVIIFPNPFHDMCNIELSPTCSEKPIFRLLNVEGEQVNVNISGSNSNYELYKGHLPAGVYILSITMNGITSYKKLSILN